MTILNEGPKCRSLRSKSSFGSFGEHQEHMEAMMGGTTTYWCLNTMGKAGPDEHFAHGTLCREGRGCWQSPDGE